MKFPDRYSSAVNSRNLSVNPDTRWSDTDVLAAAGLAARYEPLGLALTRLFADGKAESTIAILADMAFKRARTKQIKMSRVQAQDLSVKVLAWYRFGTCQPCGGIGALVIPGTPVQGETCPHCRGTGKRDFDREFQADVLSLARWLSVEIERSQAAAGTAAMVKLADKMEL